MSDCPKCDNEGWTLEFNQTDPDDDLKGEWYRLKCPNWRHEPRPSLSDIAAITKQRRIEGAKSETPPAYKDFP